MKGLNVELRLPPEVLALAKRLNGAVDQAIELAWMDGFRSGLLAGLIGALFVALLCVVLWRRKA